MALHGRDVQLKGVSVDFGTFEAVRPTDLAVRAGELFSILGPSGCGKTTLLRVVAGFLAPSAGRVVIGGADMTELGPNRRPTALIFQNLALFPLMTVAENIAFGLEARGVGRRERRRRAEELIELVALDGLADRMPDRLSGGERQRVAIARALAVEPSVLLLDEPLSALDQKLRQHMRAELKALQRRTGVTFLYITHDQSEALAMSDRIAVMNEGRIEQVDTPDRLYSMPATPFVAGFVGEQNVYPGRVADADTTHAVVETALGPIRGRTADRLAPGAAATVMVRPERIGLSLDRPFDNRFEATLVGRTLAGPSVVYEFALPGGGMVVEAANQGPQAALLASVHAVGFDADDAVVFAARRDA